MRTVTGGGVARDAVMRSMSSAAALLLLALLTGCAGGEFDPVRGKYVLADLTLAEAREVMDDEVARLAAFFPPEIWAEEYTGPIGPRSAMWCDPKESGPVDESYGVKLPGGATLIVDQDADLEPLFRGVADVYEAKEGWRVERKRDGNGWLDVNLRSPAGYKYYLSYFAPRFTPDVWEVSIWSFSPCMPVADDYSPHKEY